MNERAHRGTIHVEEAEILAHTAHAGGQHVLRLRAPRCAVAAKPGSFAHLQCDPELALRRPLSIMRASPHEGWVEFLYKVIGKGTALLANRAVGDSVSLLGPIGEPFRLSDTCRRPLLLGGGVGIPPMIFLAETLRGPGDIHAVAFFGSEIPFPFQPRPSQFLLPGIPPGSIACSPLLDDWGIPSRLASRAGIPGCHEGLVTDLAHRWLESLPESARREVQVFACGPHPMLEASARLAEVYGLPCQVSLEEYMACAVGGCAGCVVEVREPRGPAMKRVCVDGPVFDARQVFPTSPP